MRAGITNPNNTFEGNVAAATEGWGWFVHTRLRARGASQARWPSIQPSATPLRRFAGNSVRTACAHAWRWRLMHLMAATARL